MPSQRLSRTQTRQRLRSLGIDQSKLAAFSFAEDRRRISYDWHTHSRHQLLYAVRGVGRLESRDAQFLLPPQRAAWIPAGTRHATHVGQAEIISIYFDRGWSKLAELQVFEVPSLLREMVLYARRWPITRRGRDPEAIAFFRALLVVISDLARRAPAYELPRGRSPETAAAISWVLAHLDHAELAAAARSAHLTPRTLRRRFLAETGIHFRAFVTQARVQRAMTLLADSARSVLQVSLEVGFASPSAFAQAFRRATGQTPRGYRDAVALGSRPE